MKRFRLLGLCCALLFGLGMQAQITQIVVETTPLSGTVTDMADGNSFDFTGYTQYNIYAEVAEDADAYLSLFGSFNTFDNEAHPLSFSTTTAFFNHPQGGSLGDDQLDPTSFIAGFYASAAFDSYLTIGLKYDGDTDFAAPQSLDVQSTPAELAAFGATFDSDFGATGASYSSTDIAVFSTPQASNSYREADGRVYLGQLVTDGDLTFSLNSTFNESTNGTDGVGGTPIFYYATNTVETAEDDIERILTGGIYPGDVDGCTEMTACNYNEDATNNDGSCVFADGNCEVCIDGAVVLQDADGDGVCDGDEVAGCTDMAACNFDMAATDEDGSCVFADGNCEVCVNGAVVLQDADGDGVCDGDEVAGCTDMGACNYDMAATDEDGSCVFADGNCEVCINGAVVLQDADGDGVCDGDEVAGCTDMAACNYDMSATDEDGSCVFADGNCEVCINGAVVLQDADGDGVCDGDEVAGCTAEAACNYNMSATDDDGSCVFADGNCEVCMGGAVVLQDADGDGVCDGDEVAGCTDMAACNYDMSATDEDGSCVYADEANCIFCVNGALQTQDADGDGVCDGDEVAGCTDMGACNYSVAATDDDGSCVFADEAACEICEDGGVTVLDADGDGVCDFDEVAGCTDMAACNYDMAATDDDGSCEFADENCEVCINGAVVLQDADGDGICDDDEVGGCTDMTACNFDAEATDNTNCIYADDACEVCIDGAAVLQDADGDGVCDGDEIAGCTDMAACNYDETATDEDGSCAYADEANCIVCIDGELVTQDADGDGVCDGDEVAGCTDMGACNYSVAATDDDGSCVFADEAACEICEDGGVTVLDADGDGVCDFDEVAGCTDVDACNYDEEATDDDGSCIVIEAATISTEDNTSICAGDGIGDPINVSVAGGSAPNSTFVITDDSFNILAIPGGGGPFDLEGAGAGTCLIWYLGYGDDVTNLAVGTNVLDLDGCWDVSNEITVERAAAGCTDPEATNYDSEACGDDGSCTFDGDEDCGVTQLIASHCDGTFDVTDFIKAVYIPCATDYIFNLTDGDGNTESYATGAAFTKLYFNGLGIDPGTYSVSVSTQQPSGIFTGSSCDITIAAPSTCVLAPYTAPNVVAESGFLKIGYIGLAADYTWKITRTDVEELSFYYNPGSNFTRVDVDQLPMVAGATYSIEVRIESAPIGGGVSTSDPGAGAYGPAKSVTIAGGIPESTIQDENAQSIASDAVMSVYPNPVVGSNFTLNLSGLAAEEGMVNVTIFDATGKIVQAQTFAVAQGRVVEQMSLNSNVQSGMYIVQIVSGNETQTERLMIQK